MKILATRRTVLGILVATCLFHIWAYFAPQTWYETFPGIGRGWLLRLGPYNEHLVKDMASLYMAMLVVTAMALRYVNDNRYVQTTGAAWLAFNVFHTLYHFQHLSMYSTGEKVAMMSLLSVLTVLSAVLLAPAKPLASAPSAH
ncbi:MULTISPECIES: hypothetical protein [Streptomyces]|uniref:hypothetical protein n=1 Tax=Streptomyces TaxID=1883 RepID=UPI00240CE9C0|nr:MULTISPECIES: hypothetical protein [Streptomyces]WFB88473.1 hypothetical protein MMU79_37155 [Streptomyces olivaceus]WGK50916.1 hypothetical protein M6G09_37900 [Streptomyces sp. B146]